MDLTTITTPYGLLDADTQKALREHEGVIEVYYRDGLWRSISDPEWSLPCTYRVRPEPPKPREWWIKDCIAYPVAPPQEPPKGNGYIHVREVL